MRESYRATATAGTQSLESGGVRTVHMNPEGEGKEGGDGARRLGSLLSTYSRLLVIRSIDLEH